MAAVENMGVTLAVKVADLPAEPGALALAITEVVKYAQDVRLREHVGGARPRGDFTVDVRGPEEDPLQGWIYGVSVWAPFDPDDLTPNCPAAVARRHPERRGPAGSERH